MSPEATIVITTKDRRDELARLLPTALAQEGDVEVLVIDDGSSDGTADMVRAEFPEARLDRSERSLGLIAQRTRAASLARGRIIVSVDDDALLPSPRTVAQTLADFDHPRIGAVAIPFVDVRTTTAVRQEAPDREGRWVTSSYIGTAHAVRRDVFEHLGGYRGGLAQMVEEPDLCLRMLQAGYVTRLGRADHLHHLESAKRNLPRIIALGRRNDLLHGWHNVPMPYLAVRWAKVTLDSIRMAIRWRAPGAVARGLAAGFRDSLRRRADRTPVSRPVYRLDHDLRKRGPLPLEEIEGRLPPAALD
jgi:glycosyltransferase involved in cell wall biosynthesis